MNSSRHAIRRSAIRIGALSCGLFIITAVIIANLGHGPAWWPFLQSVPFGDKFGHFGLFGILGFFCNRAFPNFRLRHLPQPITAATFILLILVSLEEISQAFIPTRSCDLFDWLADLAGLAIGQITAISLSRLFPTSETPIPTAQLS